MDIFAYAKEINYGADYYDTHTGYIFEIVDYKQRLDEAIKNGEDPDDVAMNVFGPGQTFLGCVKPDKKKKRGNLYE